MSAAGRPITAATTTTGPLRTRRSVAACWIGSAMTTTLRLLLAVIDSDSVAAVVYAVIGMAAGRAEYIWITVRPHVADGA